ncbi:hypothetical protein M4D79_23205 [Mycolicibacterium novocastrense]|nr:hypothetical protein M4D79_23205 [Mycolicibacterium novocastrense]
MDGDEQDLAIGTTLFAGAPQRLGIGTGGVEFPGPRQHLECGSSCTQWHRRVAALIFQLQCPLKRGEVNSAAVQGVYGHICRQCLADQTGFSKRVGDRGSLCGVAQGSLVVSGGGLCEGKHQQSTHPDSGMIRGIVPGLLELYGRFIERVLVHEDPAMQDQCEGS